MIVEKENLEKQKNFNKYKAEILADSLSPRGDRLTTMKITFPRIVLSEFNTHRMFSRNSASSRAIPFKKMVEMVKENPFVPIAWQKAHTGMQGTEYITDNKKIKELEAIWLYGRDRALETAKALHSDRGSDIPVTKQLCNRLLEPFLWHTVIVTATEWENFFKLRCPDYRVGEFKYRSKKDAIKHQNELGNNELKNLTDLEWLRINYSHADIHIQAIAELMWDIYNESQPRQLKVDEWHIPFGDVFDWDEIRKSSINENDDMLRIKIATARCARISYQTLGDNPKIDYKADLRLHDSLVANGHASPFEHCAKVMNDNEYYNFFNGNKEDNSINSDKYLHSFGWCRNFRGFIQYRHLLNL